MAGAGVSDQEKAGLRRAALLGGLVLVSCLALPWLNVWSAFATPFGILWLAVILPLIMVLAAKRSPAAEASAGDPSRTQNHD